MRRVDLVMAAGIASVTGGRESAVIKKKTAALIFPLLTIVLDVLAALCFATV